MLSIKQVLSAHCDISVDFPTDTPVHVGASDDSTDYPTAAGERRDLNKKHKKPKSASTPDLNKKHKQPKSASKSDLKKKNKKPKNKKPKGGSKPKPYLPKLNLANFSANCNEAHEISFQLSHNTTTTFKMRKPKKTKSRGGGVGEVQPYATFMSGEDEHGSSINLIRKPDGTIIGSISEVVGGTVFDIKVDDDGNNVIDTKLASDFPPEADPMDIVPPHLQERFLLEPKGNENRPQSSANDHNSFLGALSPQISSQVDNSRRSEETVTTIDVMVVWTKKAECRNYGQGQSCTTSTASTEAMQYRIDLAILETNEAYAQSGVNAELLLVHSYLSDYVESADDAFIKALTHIKDSQDVSAKREQYGADVVAMMIDDSQYCGIGYFPSSVNKDYMFSVTWWYCATGYYSFGHEIGKNMVLCTKHPWLATNFDMLSF